MGSFISPKYDFGQNEYTIEEEVGSVFVPVGTYLSVTNDLRHVDLSISYHSGTLNTYPKVYANYGSSLSDGNLTSPADAAAEDILEGNVIETSTIDAEGRATALVHHEIDHAFNGQYFQFWFRSDSAVSYGFLAYQMHYSSEAVITDLAVSPFTYADYIESGVTGTSLADKARTRLQDTTDGSFTDAILLEFINDGIKDFALQTGSILDVFVGSPDALPAINNILLDKLLGTPSVVQPISVIQVYESNKLLRFAPREQTGGWDVDDTSSLASAWSQYGNMLILDKPITNTISILYSYSPLDISALTDSTKISSQYANVITDYLLYRAYDMDREGGLAERSFMAYQRGAESVSEIMEKQFVSGPYGTRRQPSGRRRHKRRGEA